MMERVSKPRCQSFRVLGVMSAELLFVPDLRSVDPSSPLLGLERLSGGCA